MYYTTYHQRRFIRLLLIGAAFLLLAACSTSPSPQLTPADEIAYVGSVEISPELSQAEVEAMYGGSTIVYKPEAGFAVLGFSEQQSKMTTVSLTSNTDTFASPEVSAQGLSAWAGGWNAWAGGWNAWAGGWNAWAGGWNAWAGGWNAWAGGAPVVATLAENLSTWEQIKLAEGQRLAPKLGAGIKVAVLDTGVMLTHPALVANLAPSSEWKDFIDNDSYPFDASSSGGSNQSVGHGTAVAGIIMQVAPNATILPIRVLDADGIGDTDDIIQAIDWAVEQGADIINMSLGTDVGDEALHLMLEYAANQGVLVVTSAGNEGKSGLTFPAQWANSNRGGAYLVSVGSVDKDDRKSSFSNYAASLEMLAPGEQIYTTVGQDGDNLQKGHVTGTSFAAPMVAGTLALAIAEQPTLTPRATFQNQLETAAHSIYNLNPNYLGKLGYGRLDVEAFLMELGQQFTPTKQVLYVHETSELNDDLPYIERLELLGFGVTLVDDNLVSAASANGKDLVVIASTTNSGNVNTKLRDLTVPVITWESYLFDDMKMTGAASSEYGNVGAQTAVRLGPTFATDVTVFTWENNVSWGKPSASAVIAATIKGDSSKAAVFSYEKGASMVGMTAPARRAGLMFGNNGANVNHEGWALFDAAVIWAVSSTPPAGSASLEVRVSQTSDDAEERLSSGSMYLDSSDLELVDEGGDDKRQVVGIRFQNVAIPRGATITAAYLEFATDETDSVSTSLAIRGEATNSASPFSSQAYNISGRAKTSASVAWTNVAAWNQVGQKHQTPDLSAIVQEIVNRGGWTPGNAMAFIITGSGERTAEAYDGESAKAPLLHVEYSQ